MWLITEVLTGTLAVVAIVILTIQNVVQRKVIRGLRADLEKQQAVDVAVALAKMAQSLNVAIQQMQIPGQAEEE